MQFSSIVSIAALLVAVSAAPSAHHKRYFTPGQCGMHGIQTTRTDNDDTFTGTIFDGAGIDIGDFDAGDDGISDATPVTIDTLLPSPITCTQPPNSHDINCDYNGEDFGTTDVSCSIGDWDDGDSGQRQFDCGFAC